MAATPLDDNFIDWLPIREGERILRLNDTPKNMTGVWDWLIVTDIFARVPSHFDGAQPYRQFFECIKEHLAPGGHLVLAVDNRYGLSYFAGCKERLTKTYFEGLEGYGTSEGVRTFSKGAVLSMAGEAGFSGSKTYYPYPDYRQMAVLYSDKKLPQPGELTRKRFDPKEERLVLFDEGKVFDGLLKEGRFQEFSDSYLFDLTLEKADAEEEILFVKYSVERDVQYRIRTEIVKKADGTTVVRKAGCTEEAEEHIRGLKKKEALLKEQCEKHDAEVNRCVLTQKGAEFEFLYGETLEEKLDALLAEKNFTALTEEICRFARRLEEILSPQEFVRTEKFAEIFGEVEFSTPQRAAAVNNVDWIFSNIIVTADGRWNVIDYEWTFEFPIPIKFIIYRALSLYCHGKGRECLQSMGIYRMLGITEGEELLFLEMEHRMQLYLLGGTQTMEAIVQEQSGKTITLSELLKKAHQPEMKLYFDFGAGFSEENSKIIEAEEDFYGRRRFDIPLPPDVKAVRLDPCEEACQTVINRIAGECSGAYELNVSHNGKAYENTVIYTTNDPQILIGGIVPGSSAVHVDITVEFIREETAYAWMKLLQRAEKCDRIEAFAPYRLLKKIKGILKKD